MKLTDMCKHGTWVCKSCGFPFAEPKQSIFRSCPTCRSYRIKWVPPVEGFASRCHHQNKVTT